MRMYYNKGREHPFLLPLFMNIPFQAHNTPCSLSNSKSNSIKWDDPFFPIATNALVQVRCTLIFQLENIPHYSEKHMTFSSVQSSLFLRNGSCSKASYLYQVQEMVWWQPIVRNSLQNSTNLSSQLTLCSTWNSCEC